MGKRGYVYLLSAFALTLVIAVAVGQRRSALATTEDWTPNHPGMYGGRVTALAFSPIYVTDTTLFAGTYDGGIFRSLDGGLHWQIINNGLNDWVIWDLTLSPNFETDRTLFAATAGVLYKSTNGGDIWINSSNGLAQVDWGVQALTISPNYAHDKTVFAGTDAAGVFRSTDGGTNWITVTNGITDTYIQDLAISPNYISDRTLFAGTRGGVFRSNNGGDSWMPVNTGLTDLSVMALVVSPNFASDQVIFAATGHSGVFRSANAGNSWTPVNANLPSLDMIDLAIAPDYGNGSVRTLFAALDHDGVVKSTDGGETWQSMELSGIQMEALAVSPTFATDQTLLAGMGSGGGLYKSTDGGNNWSHEVTGITAVEVTDLVASPNLANDNMMFAASYGAGVFRSEDRGGSWTALKNGITAPIIHALGISPAFASDRTLYAGTFNGIFRTTDRGNSWLNVGLSGYDVRAIVFSPDFATDHILVTGTDGGLFKSEDSGGAWSLVKEGLPVTDRGFPVPILSLGISPNFSQDHTIFAGTAENGVYRSTDGGAFWTPVNNGIGEGRISVLAVSPTYTTDPTVYAMKRSSYELYRSTNGGDSWSLVDTSGASGWVERLVFSPNYANDHKIYIGTHYQGVYYTNNVDPWTHLEPGQGLHVGNIRGLAVVQTDTTSVLAGTSGSGVWRYDLNDIPLSTITPTPGPAPCPTPVWNALIYLNGDNDLDYWTEILFNKLEQAAVNPCVHIFALWDRSGSNNTRLYWVQPDDQLSTLASYTENVNLWPRGEQDMGNPQTLVNFVTQVRSSFTATHTFLSIVDHGNGWSPSIPPGPRKYIHAGMSFDDSSGGAYLSTESLAGALGAITSGSNKLDIVFFDACLMGMAENLYPLRNFVQFVVASQNETFSSYPYADYLREIDGNTEPGELAANIVERYNDSLAGYPRTMAAYDLSRMPAVSNAVDSLARELIRLLPAQQSQIRSIFTDTQKFDSDVDLRLTISDTYVDLHHFAQLVTQNVDDSAVDASAQALMAAISGPGQPLVLLNRQVSGVFYANGQTWEMGNAHGLSIYLPLGKNDFFLRYYGERELTFARDTAWDEFIRTMAPAVQVPVDPPEAPDDRPGPLDMLSTPTATPTTATATPTDSLTPTATPTSTEPGGSNVDVQLYLPLVDH